MEKIETSKSWNCGLAWHGLSIQANGGIRPCCRYSLVHPIDNFEAPEQSSELKAIRDQMLQGQIPTGCVRCKEDEVSGIRSKRMRAQKWFSSPPTSNEAGAIRVIEFSIGNLCNARCLMCSSHLSSAWNQEVERIGHQKSPLFPGDEKRILVHLSSVRELEVIGGETFLGDHFLRLLRAIDQQQVAGNIVLKLVTNLSVFPSEKTLELLQKFKRVEIFGSIDGYKDRNTLIRYPIAWEMVEKNVNRYLEWTRDLVNIHFSVIHSSSALSFGTLPQLLEWWEKLLQLKGLSSENRFWFNSVIDPDFQALNVLPLEFRRKIVQRLRSINHLCSARKVLEAEAYLLEPQNTHHFPKLKSFIQKFEYRSSAPLPVQFPEIFEVPVKVQSEPQPSVLF